jgi:NAD-dependent dihydropyrimidine dehydrogenase PreA subunit
MIHYGEGMKHRYIAGVTSLTITADKCTGCGRCIEVCPHEVFDLQNRKVIVIAQDNCMECGACTQNCVFGALSVKSGVGCATAMINGLMTKGDPDLGTCDCSGDTGGCC